MNKNIDELRSNAFIFAESLYNKLSKELLYKNDWNEFDEYYSEAIKIIDDSLDSAIFDYCFKKSLEFFHIDLDVNNELLLKISNNKLNLFKFDFEEDFKYISELDFSIMSDDELKIFEKDKQLKMFFNCESEIEEYIKIKKINNVGASYIKKSMDFLLKENDRPSLIYYSALNHFSSFNESLDLSQDYLERVSSFLSDYDLTDEESENVFDHCVNILINRIENISIEKKCHPLNFIDAEINNLFCSIKKSLDVINKVENKVLNSVNINDDFQKEKQEEELFNSNYKKMKR